MQWSGKKGRLVELTMAALAVVFMTLPAAEATGANFEGQYSSPSSYRVAPVLGHAIFGIGVVTCDTGSQAGRLNLAKDTGVYNGACWPVGFEHDGHPFQVAAADNLFGGQVSIGVVFDYTGTGCQSASCGVPDQARFSGCGAVTGTVPTGRAGTAVWVFVRAIDVNPLTGDLCLASQGELFGSF